MSSFILQAMKYCISWKFYDAKLQNKDKDHLQLQFKVEFYKKKEVIKNKTTLNIAYYV